jgi:hypothetical protein
MMVAENDTGETPTRPVIFDHTLGWAAGAGMEQQELSALRHVAANHAAQQAAAAPDIDTPAPQQPDAQQDARGVAPNPENVPLPNTGWGQERPQGTYDELKAATPAPEPEPQASADAEIPQPEPAPPVQEGQESAEQPAPMTARQRHEARLQAFIQGGQEDRQAAKEEVENLTEGADAAIEEALGQVGLGVSGPHIGGGMSR